MATDKRNIRISLSYEELSYLEHVLWHFSDYMAYDDRPDHGLGVLKQYRKIPQEKKSILFALSGRLRRLYRKQQKQMTNELTGNQE